MRNNLLFAFPACDHRVLRSPAATLHKPAPGFQQPSAVREVFTQKSLQSGFGLDPALEAIFRVMQFIVMELEIDIIPPSLLTQNPVLTHPAPWG